MPGHGGPRHKAPRIAKDMYITDPEGISLRKLAKELKGQPGAGMANLAQCSKAENWPAEREKYQQTISELTRLKSIPEAATVLEKIQKARLALIDAASISIQARMINGEPMQYGTASTVVMNQGREVIEYLDTVGAGAGAGAPAPTLTPEREKEIMLIPNPLEDAEKEGENGDKG